MRLLRLACVLAVRLPQSVPSDPPQCLLGALAAPPNASWFIEPASNAPLIVNTPATLAVKSLAVTASGETFKLFSSDAAASITPSATVSVLAQASSANFTFTPSAPGTCCIAAEFANGSIAASYCTNIAAGSPRASYNTGGVNAGAPLSVSFSVVDANSAPVAAANEVFFVGVFPDTPYTVAPSLGASPKRQVLSLLGGFPLFELRINASTPAYQFTFPNPGRYELRFYSSLRNEFQVYAAPINVLSAASTVPEIFIATAVSLPETYLGYTPRCPASGSQCLQAGVTVFNSTTGLAPAVGASFTLSVTTDSPAVISFPAASFSGTVRADKAITIPLIVATTAVVGTTYSVTVRLRLVCVCVCVHAHACVCVFFLDRL